MVENELANQSSEEMEASLARAVQNISRELRRSKRAIVWITISLIFDICLSIIVGGVVYFTHQLSENANKNASALVVNCESANQARTLNKNLWDYVLNLPTVNNPNETAAQKSLNQKNVTNFRSYVDKIFAQQDCSKLNASNIPTSTIPPLTTTTSPGG